MTTLEVTDNIILLTDSYKTSHNVQYPQGTEYVFSYLESRGGKFNETVVFGLQYFLKKYLSGQVVTQEKINEAEEILLAHGVPFNRQGWEYILNTHNGRLPIEIKIVPEGTVVPTKNVLMTVVNTDPKCFWLTNYLETLLLEVWYPTTVATLSREMKKLIMDSLNRTCDSPNNVGLEFKLHDFGFRGVSSPESAAIGAMAHLVNFMGTDTLPGILAAKRIYGAPMAGFSIPASEHSTITSWGGEEKECAAFENMLNQYPSGLVACVSDSYNIYRAIDEYWGTALKDKILNRDGTLVIRPDSGVATEVLPELLKIAWNRFGGTINDKGYKVLDPHVRFIWGDGIEYEALPGILKAIEDSGFSTENLAFGMGGALLQKVNRDTQKFAFKCSAICVNGKWQDVYKQPVHDSFKKSKKGVLGLFKHQDTGELYTKVISETKNTNILETVFMNGAVTKEYLFDEIRARARI